MSSVAVIVVNHLDHSLVVRWDKDLPGYAVSVDGVDEKKRQPTIGKALRRLAHHCDAIDDPDDGDGREDGRNPVGGDEPLCGACGRGILERHAKGCPVDEPAPAVTGTKVEQLEPAQHSALFAISKGEIPGAHMITGKPTERPEPTGLEAVITWGPTRRKARLSTYCAPDEKRAVAPSRKRSEPSPAKVRQRMGSVDSNAAALRALEGRARIATVLSHYMRKAFEAGGLQWTDDNAAEMVGLATEIVDVASFAALAELGE